MKKTLMFAIIAFSLCFSCSEKEGSDYLSHFKAWNKEKIEYDNSLLGEPLESPFGLGEIHPLGNVDAGGERVITFAGISEEEAAFGQVIAELFVKGERVDQLTVAEADLGIYIYSNLDLPGLVRWEEKEEGDPISEKFIVTNEGFKPVP